MKINPLDAAAAAKRKHPKVPLEMKVKATTERICSEAKESRHLDDEPALEEAFASQKCMLEERE